MTPIQIAYFKHFLFDKGIQRIYISLYRLHKLGGDEKGDLNANPKSLEQFFKQVHASKVIMKAFYFPMNSDYGYDYWSALNDQWKEYWDMHKNNFSNDKYVTLKGTFAILRQNWDNEKYWKEESKEKTYKRMAIEIPPVEGNIETAFDLYSEEDKEDEPEVQIETTKESKPGDLLEGFTMVDAANIHGGRKMAANSVSVNLRNGGYRITFSSNVTDKLRKHKYEYVRLLTNKDTKEIAFTFNHQGGCIINFKKSRGDRRNVTINSKEIVNHIHSFYGMTKKEDYYFLKITATINQDNSTTYKLKLQEQ